MAEQYGKSISTIRRYAAENRRIKRTPTLAREESITQAEQVEKLTADARGARGGRYLELQESGTRIAATRENAAHALAQGETFVFKEHGPNYFAIDPDVTEVEAGVYRAHRRSRKRAKRYLERLAKANLLDRPYDEVRADLCTADETDNWRAIETFIGRAKERLKQGRQRAVCHDCGVVIACGELCADCASEQELLAAARRLGAVVTELPAGEAMETEGPRRDDRPHQRQGITEGDQVAASDGWLGG